MGLRSHLPVSDDSLVDKVDHAESGVHPASAIRFMREYDTVVRLEIDHHSVVAIPLKHELQRVPIQGPRVILGCPGAIVVVPGCSGTVRSEKVDSRRRDRFAFHGKRVSHPGSGQFAGGTVGSCRILGLLTGWKQKTESKQPDQGW